MIRAIQKRHRLILEIPDGCIEHRFNPELALAFYEADSTSSQAQTAQQTGAQSGGSVTTASGVGNTVNSATSTSTSTDNSTTGGGSGATISKSLGSVVGGTGAVSSIVVVPPNTAWRNAMSPTSSVSNVTVNDPAVLKSASDTVNAAIAALGSAVVSQQQQQASVLTGNAPASADNPAATGYSTLQKLGAIAGIIGALFLLPKLFKKKP